MNEICQNAAILLELTPKSIREQVDAGTLKVGVRIGDAITSYVDGVMVKVELMLTVEEVG